MCCLAPVLLASLLKRFWASDMGDWAEAIIFASVIVAFIVWGTFTILWMWG